MATTPLKNRKFPPWIAEAAKHWRWLEDRLDPLPDVTSPRYSDFWMDEVWTRDICRACRQVAEERFIEKLLRIERQRIIDKLKKEAMP